MTNEQKIKDAQSLKGSLVQEIDTIKPFTDEAVNSINELSDISQDVEFTDGHGRRVDVSDVVMALQLITDLQVGTITLGVEV